MGRMFRIITEGSLDYPAGGGPAAVALPDPEPFVSGGAPYIEVGGPNGPVHSLPKPAPKAVAGVEVTTPPPARPPAGGDRYLTVALHQIAPAPAAPHPHAVTADVVAYHHPDHPASAGYRALADELRRQVGADGPKAVLLTAPAEDNGTTTVLLNLAVTLAREPGARVLVVDADFDHPGVGRKLGLADIPGLAEAMAGTLPLAWALQPTAVTRMQALAAGAATPATGTAFATDFPALLGQLRQWFDWVLVDGGVWGERPHRDATSPAFDGVYLVTRDEDPDRPVFATVRAQVAKAGGLLRGYITTKA